jgi:hypothetical protein
MSYPPELRVALRVAFRLAGLSVHAAIQFYNEAPLAAAKVNDVLTKRMLAAELESLQTKLSQQTPGGFFGLGFILAKVAHPGDLHWPTRQQAMSAKTLGPLGFHGFHPLTRPAPAGEDAGGGPPAVAAAPAGGHRPQQRPRKTILGSQMAAGLRQKARESVLPALGSSLAVRCRRAARH